MVSSDNMLVGNEYYKPEVSSLGGFPGSEFRIEIGSPGGVYLGRKMGNLGCHNWWIHLY